MQWDVNNLAKNLEDNIVCLKALCKLKILIPEGVREEVQASTAFCAVEETEEGLSVHFEAF